MALEDQNSLHPEDPSQDPAPEPEALSDEFAAVEFEIPVPEPSAPQPEAPEAPAPSAQDPYRPKPAAAHPVEVQPVRPASPEPALHLGHGAETDSLLEPAPRHERPQPPAGLAGTQRQPQVPTTQLPPIHPNPGQRPAQAPQAQEPPVPPVEPPQNPGSSQDFAGEPAPGPAPKKRSGFWPGLLGGLLGAVLVAGLWFGVTRLAPASSQATSPSQAGPTVNISANQEDASTAEVVAAKCLPSVASINVATSQGEGVGSGVVYDTQGNILTNYHVVEDAQSLVVNLNGKSYEGTVVGSDPSSDLAVVHIDLNGDSVTPMEIADSSQLVVGQWVMSLGSPFGLDQSVSTGIVSSLYRSTILEGSAGNTIYTNLVQTDAAINPGNSGGALVNAQGQLIGINSIIQSASGSSSGVGFAIPSNYVKKAADAIIAGKPVEHAYLGANVRTVTPQVAAQAHLAVKQGAYVDSVVQGMPAAQAGLQEGDIITAIDGEAVTSGDNLILAVRSKEVGDKVTLTYYRGSTESTVDVTLGSDAEAQASQAQRRQSAYEQGDTGADAQALPNRTR